MRNFTYTFIYFIIYSFGDFQSCNSYSNYFLKDLNQALAKRLVLKPNFSSHKNFLNAQKINIKKISRGVCEK